ncbi:MAG: UDP-N-acetylglucosamine 2-epimerase (non-hydrolyzing) [Candidatus Eisenbacteria sp.]|nr:UDP-N-acetylglucosamine 2-epimerase (non-hydrolyzing) [Candidatus Eisenbacteria bacterium]
MPKMIMIVFGTRPEAIKMAPVVKALAARSDRFRLVICLSAQHREMLDQVMKQFELRADFDLNIMTRGQDLFDVSARVILGMRDVLRKDPPDVLLVHGDTTTSAIAALAAFYLKIPVGHVEAGLRSRERYSPFPEEMNRRLTASLATWHFAPTVESRRNLQSENVPAENIFVTGNTAIDALLWMREQPATRALPPTFESGRRGILVTAHRRENFGESIANICHAILELVAAFPDVEIVYPVHLNPNIVGPVERILKGHERIRLLEPVNYSRFVRLMDEAHLILTDSGGVQEEAPSLGKPVLVMRECTERPEAVQAGTVRLVGTDRHRIVATAGELLRNETAWRAMARSVNPYGDGRAAARIAGHLCNILTESGFPPEPVSEFAPLLNGRSDA